MTSRGGSHEPEKPPALPARAATADLRTLVDQLVKLGLDFAAEALPAISHTPRTQTIGDSTGSIEGITISRMAARVSMSTARP